MSYENEKPYQPTTAGGLEVVTVQSRKLAHEEIERLSTILEQTRHEMDRLVSALQQTRQELDVLREREQVVAEQLRAWRVIETAGVLASDQSGDVIGAISADPATNFPSVTDLPASTDRPSAIVQETADVVVGLLLELQQPLHYRAIYQVLNSRGLVVGGADPAKTLLARYFNDGRLQRVKRGTYAVKSGAGGDDVN